MHPVTEVRRIGRAWLHGTSHLVIGCDLATSAWPTGSQKSLLARLLGVKLGWDESANISGRIPGPSGTGDDGNGCDDGVGVNKAIDISARRMSATR